eukprot:Gb_11263 [translate_table: standard]
MAMGDLEMKNLEDGRSVWSELPEHLIESILERLPLKCLFRFRLVCRSWNALLCSAHFLEAASRQPWLILCTPRPHMHRSLLYSFSTRAWQTVSLSFIPDTCGVNYRGSATGLILVDIPMSSSFGDASQRLSVCNPLSRTCFPLPKMSSVSSVMAKGIAAGEDVQSFRVVVMGRSASDSVVAEVYSSVTKSWTMAGRLPDDLEIRNAGMVFCNGFFFSMTARGGIMAYSIKDGKSAILPLPVARNGDINVWLRPVACRCSVLTVGAVEEDCVLRDVIIWELELGERQKNPIRDQCCWKEIGKMPEAVREDFRKNSCSSNWFESVGVGDYVCFRAHGSVDVLVYSLVQGSWNWLPKCSAALGDYKYLNLRSLALEPRPHIKL